MRLPLPLGAFCALLFSFHHAEARTIYVDPRGTPNSEGTLSAPLREPERAVRSASPGDQIVLRGGVYNLKSSVYIDKPGISVVNFRGEKPVLRAPNDKNSKILHVVVVVAPRVRVEGLEIRGGSYYGVKVDVDEAKNPAHGVIIRNCRIGDSGRDCIKTFNADNLLVENCDIGPSGLRDASNAEGIDSIGSRGVTVRNCFVQDTATTGIYFKGGTTDGVIENCRVHNSRSASGILLGQDTDPEFMRDGTPFEARRCVARNNIITGTSGSGIGTFSGESIRFENNTLVDVARETGAGVWVGVNRRGVASRDVSFKNNIVIISGARPFAYLLNLSGVFGAQSNLYYSTGAPGYFRIERAKNVQTLGLGQWQRASGGDSLSRVANPLIDAARDFRPRTGSPAIGRGLRLPGITRDFSGKARRSSGNLDIGAQGV